MTSSFIYDLTPFNHPIRYNMKTERLYSLLFTILACSMSQISFAQDKIIDSTQSTPSSKELKIIKQKILKKLKVIRLDLKFKKVNLTAIANI